MRVMAKGLSFLHLTRYSSMKIFAPAAESFLYAEKRETRSVYAFECSSLQKRSNRRDYKLRKCQEMEEQKAKGNGTGSSNNKKV